MVHVLRCADWQLGNALDRFEPDVLWASTDASFGAIDAVGHDARTGDAGQLLVASHIFDI